ncbi:hypothetical protein JIQ42_07630 [Leishmania sp. Namibia]|uniref:hypothetical protein n=1 Tax=Leishmania sp. Namibia TaxID=2802991 RepID=UPI001B3DD7A3|nr:hypothetical protein JIQ42_07630 [Leishmania sp. Namibia]
MERTLSMPSEGLQPRLWATRAAERHYDRIFCVLLAFVITLHAAASVSTTAATEATFPLLLNPLPPAAPAAPWHTLNESLLPYPIFYPAIAVMNNSVLLLGGCVTAACDKPVGESGRNSAASRTRARTATAAGSPYHEHMIALNVEKGSITALPRLTLPAGLGFAGRYAAVTLTDSVYVARSCTMSTLSADDVASMTTEELRAMQAAYAPVVAFYPEGAANSTARVGGSDPPPAVNLTYFVMPADRVRVNASCTALATENKLLIIGGFLLSAQDATDSVDSFDVVTRKYEVDVAFLSKPALQPSVAASTGFAAVAGGWAYQSDTTATATYEAGATQEASHGRRSSRAGASAGLLHLPTKPATSPGNISVSPYSGAAPSASPSWRVPSPESSRPVTRYLFDLLFFDPDHLTRGACDSPLRARQTGASICRSPVDASALPRTVVEDILLSPNGCHVAVFGGQVVLGDHNLSNIAVLDIRARSAAGRAARAPFLTSPPPVVTLLRAGKQNAAARAVDDAKSAARRERILELKVAEVSHCVEASCRLSDHAALMSVSSSSSAPPSPTSTSSSSLAAASSSSLAPTPVYRYSWMQPTLIPLPYTRHPPTAAAPDPTVMTDTILIYYALGGEDVWAEVVAKAGDDGADGLLDTPDKPRMVQRLQGGTAALRNTPDDSKVVLRREPARRWAQRRLPDVDYDSGRPELLALTMPTPVWPEALTLKTNSEGIIHLAFPDVNYSRYCTWKKRFDGEADDVACAIRLSSRRDCVGNTAGTLDSAYDGTPNATILFSASGSTTPVYVCFSYVVQPTSWPMCRVRQSFSILNPMMPLRILDNSPTTPAPSPGPGPSPTRDPADKTTSSPLFMLAVGVAVVTLLVAVLLVARLQHVPDDGLLVMSLFDRDSSAGSQHAGAMARTSGGARRDGRERRKHLLQGNVDHGGGSRSGRYDWTLDGYGAGGSGGEPPKVEDGENGEDNGDTGLPQIATYAEFLQVVDGAQEESEARMLATAADVLRLHQHRYRVLSRIGQGAHSLCFLALRKAPPPMLAVQQQKVRGADAGVGRGVRVLGGGASSVVRLPPFTRSAPSFPAALPTSGPGAPTAATALASAAAASSLWTARHDQSTAVVVKYTQCPDDATRGVITRLCERLRDLQVDAVTAALDTVGVYGPHHNAAPPRHPHRRYRPSDMYSESAAAGPRSFHARTRGTCDISHEAASGTGSNDSGAAAADAPEVFAVASTAPPSSERGSSRTTTSTVRAAGCPPPTPPSLPPEEAHAIDDDDDDGGRCAWLDAHEVNVVLSLFLLLPEDLFVSYEVSVLHQQRSSGSRLTPLSVSRAAVEWNRRHVWPGRNPAQAAAPHPRQRDGCTPPLPVQQGRLEQCSPRACWAACVNPLQPSTVSPWSLCLVMPYERNGNLADFALRCRQVHLFPADGTSTRDPRSSSHSASSSRVGPVHYCWTESLLCSILFQVCTGLQLLHAQSPPILHGNIKPTNVLLREPASFSVARRRVVVAGTPAALAEREMDVSGDPDLAAATTREGAAQEAVRGEAGTAAVVQPPAASTSLWHASGLAAAAAAVWYVGSPVLRSLPSMGRQPPPREHAHLRPQELERQLLSNHTYLPISLADGGMSWWLTVQLPLRLRGCFGRTIRSTLRQTPAGLCWLRRSDSPPQMSSPLTTKSRVVPSDDCIAALANFLFAFIEVPTHVAPELLWGQLCTLSQSGHGDNEGSAAALTTRGSSPTQPPSSLYPSRSRREQYARACRRDSDSVARRRRGDITREPVPSPAAGAANLSTAAASKESGVNATEQKKAFATLPPDQQAQRQDDLYAEEDMDDMDVDLDVDEDGIFTGEEVSALTSAMWKAEGLTRVSRSRRQHRRAPTQQRVAASAVAGPSRAGAPSAPATMSGGRSAPEEATRLPVDTVGAVGGCRGCGGGGHEMLLSLSHASLLPNPTTAMSGATPISTPQLTAPDLHPGLRIGSPLLASPCSTLQQHHHDADRQPCGSSNGGRRAAGGGSRGSSSVYELLIQRVLAIDTASDVWSVGLLLYGMFADAVGGEQQQPSASTATTTLRPPYSTAVDGSRSHAPPDGADTLPAAMPACTCAPQLAQRAFAALLGDLYDLAAAGVPCADRDRHGWSCDGSGGAQRADGDAEEEAAVEQLDKAADERLRWPRSCALEDEVMQVVCNAGYTHAFASILASMLSPVAARRPSAGDIVNQLRLVIAAAPATTAYRSMRSGGGGFADEEGEYSVARHTLPPRTHHSDSADDVGSAVALDERTAQMVLRQR